MPVVPDDTAVGKFLSYMQEQETAEVFDFWCAMWLVSLAVGRRVIVNRPRAPVYLNLYAILIGESGIVRKSSAISAVNRLASIVLEHDQQITLMNARMTPEKLDTLLHDRTAELGCGQVALCISELTTVMGNEAYNNTLPALLTDLYDCPSTRNGAGTQRDGALLQKNVWISFIAASTPTWLMKTVNPTVSEGGFTSRCLFISADAPKRRIAWPTALDPVDVAVRGNQIANKLSEIRNQSMHRPVIELSDGAMDLFVRWYNARVPALDVFMGTFEAREDAHILRLAALLCINDGSWKIHLLHLEAAMERIAEVKRTASRVFSRSGERTRYALSIELLRTVLINTGMDPVPRGLLYRRLARYLDHSEFMALIDIMHEHGAIQRFHMKRDEGAGRPTDYIRGTTRLLEMGLAQKIVERFVV
jgi:hypothetical protein